MNTLRMVDRINRAEEIQRYTENRCKALEEENTKQKQQAEKMKYTLKKIMETVQNDRLSEYGARLVSIYDFASECLEEVGE